MLCISVHAGRSSDLENRSEKRIKAVEVCRVSFQTALGIGSGMECSGGVDSILFLTSSESSRYLINYRCFFV
jgi:predicted Holliday junction resolvase-like endonuclease